MAGRPRHYKDEELLDRAIEVFWAKGYNAASAKNLLEGMGIGQGSFYSTFPGGKKELYQKSLRYFFEKSIKQFEEGVKQSADPKAFLKSFFLRVANRREDEKMNGCYLGNAVIELTNLDEETRKISADLLEKLRKHFKKALVKAQKSGTLDSSKSPEELSIHLLNLWNGINVTQRMYPQNKQIKSIIEYNLALLD